MLGIAPPPFFEFSLVIYVFLSFLAINSMLFFSVNLTVALKLEPAEGLKCINLDLFMFDSTQPE